MINVGTILQENSFYKVTEVLTDGYILELNGKRVKLSKDYVDNFTISADNYTETVKISRTELNGIIETKQNTVMTICYDKKIDVDKALKAAKAGNLSEVQVLLTPEERTIKGVHYGLDDNGRYKFVDMELQQDTTKNYDNRLRQVDPRTIKYAIFNSKKYQVK